jgi:hypothetical protein
MLWGDEGLLWGNNGNRGADWREMLLHVKYDSIRALSTSALDKKPSIV